MASFARGAVGLALVLATSGCLSGHLLDAARRREVPASVRAVWLDRDDLAVTIRTTTVTDLDRPVGGRTVRARIALTDLARDLPIERLPIRFESAARPPRGRPLLILTADAVTSPRPIARLALDGRGALTLQTLQGEYPPLHLDALTRTRYAPWAWALMPAALAVDAAIVPPLLLFAPAVIVLGD